MNNSDMQGMQATPGNIHDGTGGGMAVAVQRTAEPQKLGVAFAESYLADLAEWNVQYQSSPIEAIKSFLIYTTGFDVATRNTDSGFTFYLMDAQRLPAHRPALHDRHFGQDGRYFCAQCSMFFEYGQPQSQVTCPFMPQKCKFWPQADRRSDHPEGL